MKRTPDNRDLASRLGADESDLLAWIEGDVDDATDERMQRLLRAASVEDARDVVAMRRDAILLNTLDVERAPHDLVELAVAQADTDLERGMLLEDGRPIPFGQARTRVVRSPSWILDAVFDSVAGRVAIAAVLIVSAGSAVYLAMGTWNTQPLAPIRGPVAVNDDDQATPITDELVDQDDAAALMTTAEAPIEESVPDPIPETVAEAMPMETAKALGAQRRLLVRVTTESSLDTLTRLDGFARESHRGRPWMLARSHDEMVIASLEPHLPGHDSLPTSLPETILAGEDDAVQPIDLTGALMPPVPEITPPVYIASVRLDDTSLESLVNAVQRGAVTGIELVELDEPLPLPETAPTRDAILWWGRPVEEWLPRTDVAVIIDVQ